MYTRIAVAVDGSSHALRATQEAIRLANTTSIIELIYVIDIDHIHLDMLHAASTDALLLTRRQKIAPFEEAVRRANHRVETTILKGSPAATLIEYVNAQHIDLLAIGSRGLNTLQQMVLGSVSHKVMKHVHCPVLIVK